MAKTERRAVEKVKAPAPREAAPPSEVDIKRDLTRTTLALLFLGVLIIASLWVVAPFLPAVIWATTLVVNLRHVLYSATLAPYVAHLPRRWRWALAGILTDEVFAVA